MAEYTARTTANAMINVHEPPKEATPSAIRSPSVSASSITSFGLRAARRRTSLSAAWNCLPMTVIRSRPASGFFLRRTVMSWRSTSMHSVSSTAVASVWCGVCASIEAKPNTSPWLGMSRSTTWLSSSMVVTWTEPETMMNARSLGSPILKIRWRGVNLRNSTWPARTASSSSSSKENSGTSLRTTTLQAMVFPRIANTGPPAAGGRNGRQFAGSLRGIGSEEVPFFQGWQTLPNNGIIQRRRWARSLCRLAPDSAPCRPPAGDRRHYPGFHRNNWRDCMARPLINIADVELEPRPAAFAPTGTAEERFDARMGFIGPRIGARKLGYNITAVPPGKRAVPFHNHQVNEEMLFILQGTGEGKIGAQTYTSLI